MKEVTLELHLEVKYSPEKRKKLSGKRRNTLLHTNIKWTVIFKENLF